MDGMKVIMGNPTEVIVTQAVAEVTDEQVVKLQRRLAQMIASEVSRLFKKGR